MDNDIVWQDHVGGEVLDLALLYANTNARFIVSVSSTHLFLAQELTHDSAVSNAAPSVPIMTHRILESRHAKLVFQL